MSTNKQPIPFRIGEDLIVYDPAVEGSYQQTRQLILTANEREQLSSLRTTAYLMLLDREAGKIGVTMDELVTESDIERRIFRDNSGVDLLLNDMFGGAA